MAQVDPDDDSLDRYIVWHYAYDPARHERRNQVVAAFDDAREFEDYVDRAQADLRRRQATDGVDPKEHFGGVIKLRGREAQKQARREAMWRLMNGTATGQDIVDLGPSVTIARLDENA